MLLLLSLQGQNRKNKHRLPAQGLVNGLICRCLAMHPYLPKSQSWPKVGPQCQSRHKSLSRSWTVRHLSQGSWAWQGHSGTVAGELGAQHFRPPRIIYLGKVLGRAPSCPSPRSVLPGSCNDRGWWFQGGTPENSSLKSRLHRLDLAEAMRTRWSTCSDLTSCSAVFFIDKNGFR